MDFWGCLKPGGYFAGDLLLRPAQTDDNREVSAPLTSEGEIR